MLVCFLLFFGGIILNDDVYFECVILIDSPDEKGLVQKITKIILEHNLNMDKNDEFVDTNNSLFFMRSEVSGSSLDKDILYSSLHSVLPEKSNISILDKNKKKKVILFSTKETHALGDILLRSYENDLNIDILAVISNREKTRDLVEKFCIEYICIDSDNISRDEHESKILSILSKFSFEYIILAKYMRILSDDFTSRFENKIINIHHSFLPAFIGANPYLKAYNRGVKIIGATAHFVTKELDEGPIIVQDIGHINHSYSLEQMKQSGRTIEKNTISKAIKLVSENKVFVNGNKTIVFE